MKHLHLAPLLLLAASFPSAPAQEQPVTPFLGVDANYSLDMEKAGQKWRWGGQEGDLFKGIAEKGVRGFRVRLWTKDDGPNGKTYATEVVKRTTAAGLDPYLVIFLSEDWADLMKQPAPAAWKDLDLPKRAEAVKAYSRDIVAHFRKEGLKSHLYEIGNEIDYGICGVYPGKSTKKNPESLGRACWPEAAQLIRASQEGVKEADPEARFLLHIAHWWDEKFVIGFFRFMLDHGVTVDFAGLSYFPSSNIGGSLEMGQFGTVVNALHAAIQRPIIVPEVAYPSTADFKGQFSRWKKEAPGYPLTPEGQRRWAGDFLDFCATTPAIAAVYFWSPEWCGEGMWKAFAFFDPQVEAKPVWSALTKPRDQRSKQKQSVFFEAREGKVHAVPVAEVREKAKPMLAEKLKTFGRVNVEYIKDITAARLVVGDYRVLLRASLSGNLDLELTAEAKGQADWAASVEKLDPATQRLVVFARDPKDPAVAQIEAAARKRGLECIVHPVALDKPLKFGLGAGVQSDAVY